MRRVHLVIASVAALVAAAVGLSPASGTPTGTPTLGAALIELPEGAAGIQAARSDGGETIGVGFLIFNDATSMFEVWGLLKSSGVWSAPQLLSDPTTYSTDIDVDVIHNRAVFAWVEDTADPDRIVVRDLTPTGPGTRDVIDVPPYSGPLVSVDINGERAVGWSRYVSGDLRAFTAVAPPGGSFAAVEQVPVPSGSSSTYDYGLLALAAGDGPQVLFSRYTGTITSVGWGIRTATGWETEADIAVGYDDSSTPPVAVMAGGSQAAVTLMASRWDGSSPTHRAVLFNADPDLVLEPDAPQSDRLTGAIDAASFALEAEMIDGAPHLFSQAGYRVASLTSNVAQLGDLVAPGAGCGSSWVRKAPGEFLCEVAKDPSSSGSDIVTGDGQLVVSIGPASGSTSFSANSITPSVPLFQVRENLGDGARDWLLDVSLLGGSTPTTTPTSPTTTPTDTSSPSPTTTNPTPSGPTAPSTTTAPTPSPPVTTPVAPVTTFTAGTPPRIKGKPVVGARLVVKTGTWIPAPDKLSVQWYLGTKKIKRASQARLKIKSGWVGKKVSVKITVTGDGMTSTTVKVKAKGKVRR